MAPELVAGATPARVLHMVADDSALYRPRSRQKPTWCGEWVSDRELATQRDRVTCPACRAHLDRFESLDI